jgi:hypothetical protein
MSCPCSEQLLVVYRDKALPLDRRILECGTKEERKNHFAGIIAEFLEDGTFNLEDLAGSSPFGGFAKEGSDEDIEQLPDLSEGLEPISDREFDKFVRVDLKCLDNGAYFRRHFD